MVRPVVILCKYLSYEATGGAPVVFSAEERSLRDSALFVKTPRAMLPDALFVNPTRSQDLGVCMPLGQKPIFTFMYEKCFNEMASFG